MDLIIHFGLTKTASTFLQKNVFNGKMNTVDRSIESDADKKAAKEFEKFFRSNNPAIWRNSGEQYFNYNMDIKTNVIISHESLYEHVLFRPYKRKEKVESEPYLFASRIKEIKKNIWKHGDVKVLFFYRRQVDWIPSIYSQVCNELKSPSQLDFEKRVKKILSYPYQGAQVLEYDLLIEVLSEFIGSKNVLGMPYEMMGNNDTWKEIRNFTGIESLAKDVDFAIRDVNVKRQKGEMDWKMNIRATPVERIPGIHFIKPVTKKILRKSAYMLRDKLNRLLIGGDLRLHIPEDLTLTVKKHYNDSNKRLQKTTSVMSIIV